MNSLVTGAGGFLGHYIVEQLVARGDRVRVFSRNRYEALDRLGAETIVGDVRDRPALVRACKGVDVVFHVAAIAGIGEPWQRFFEINTLGTKNVIDGCREVGVSRLVYTSSPSVTFDGGDQCGVDESVPYPSRWLAHYPHSKALAEQAVLQANGEQGLLTCALRPHLIWGPRDQHLIPRLLQRARSGRLRRVGDGSNLIDMIYVENAAEAHLLAADALAADSPVAGKAYFISQGEPVRCWGWIDELLAMAGLPPVTRSISLKTAWRLGRIFELAWKTFRIRSDPPMTRFLAAQLATSHYFDISAARRDFGFTPHISIQEGMRRLAESEQTRLGRKRSGP